MSKSIAHDRIYFNLANISMMQKKAKQWAPYILQIAVGIHAIFEGLSIGLEKDISRCVGIALAVLCHKWAEGLTLVILIIKYHLVLLKFFNYFRELHLLMLR